MADEDTESSDITSGVPSNKKLTMFVIDGGETMFDGGNEKCAFRRALKIVFHQVLSICCSGSFSHMVGLMITNTEETKCRHNHKFCYEVIEMGFPGQDEARCIKEMLDSDNIHSAFIDVFKGHAKCDIANVMWTSKKIMSVSATAKRHHVIAYFTNDSNPFVEESRSYYRLKRTMDDFTCRTYKNVQGHQKVNKTPGEFHLVMLKDGGMSLEDKSRWEALTPAICEPTEDDIDLEVYKRTFSQRAFSNILIDVGGGIKFGVSLYTICSEGHPQTKTLVNPETEERLTVKNVYVSSSSRRTNDTVEEEKSDDDNEFIEKDDQPASRSEHSVQELKKALVIGGECLVTEPGEIDRLARFDAKGITVLGFKSIDEVNMSAQLFPAQYLYPDESQITGSATLYRALWERCKVRLVALLPDWRWTVDDLKSEVDDWESLDEKKKDKLIVSMERANEYRHEGFNVVFLPFVEDVRDLTEKMDSPLPNGKWPQPSNADTVAFGPFIRNLTKSWAPDEYFNPRIRSFNSMLIEAAIGEQTSRDDTILPYFKVRRPDWVAKVTAPVIDHFRLTAEVQSNSGTQSKKRDHGVDPDAGSKKGKPDPASMSLEEIVAANLLDKCTVKQLREMYAERGMGKLSTGAKKADIIENIQAFMKK